MPSLTQSADPTVESCFPQPGLVTQYIVFTQCRLKQTSDLTSVVTTMSDVSPIEVSNINSMLPDEMLEVIFLQLAPKHLARVAEVCTRWQQVVQAPAFWTWVKLWVDRSNLASMVERLDSRRLKGVRRLVVERDVEVSEELLEAVASHPGLRELNMTGDDLSRVEPGMLADIVNKMEKAVLWGTKLTTLQVTVLCQVMEENSQLKTLNLGWNNLSGVEPQLLASMVSKIENVYLKNTNLTNQQVTVLCQVMKENCELKCVNLHNNNLSSVQPELLASAVSKVAEVDLWNTSLTTQQVTVLCQVLSGTCPLESLNLSGNNLSGVEPDLLARAVGNIVKVQLGDTNLTSQQLSVINKVTRPVDSD